MNTRYLSVLTAVVTLVLGSSKISAQGMSYKNLNQCSQVPREIFESSEDSILNLKELPQGLYLVRSVSQSFEGQDGEKYFTYQKLLTKEESQNHLCYQGTPHNQLKVQSFLPTVIDRTKEHKWGHVFWSLSVATQKSMGAIEANRSLIPSLDYKDKLTQQGFKVEERQKSHHEFELKLERKIASWKETIILLYDQY